MNQCRTTLLKTAITGHLWRHHRSDLCCQAKQQEYHCVCCTHRTHRWVHRFEVSIQPVIIGHVPDNQAQDGPVSVSGDFNGLIGERCDDQLASPTILGRCLHDENRYMMIAFAIHSHCALHFPNYFCIVIGCMLSQFTSKDQALTQR